MTHKERFTNTSASKSNVESFIGNTALRDFIEVIEVERGTIFLRMVELISFLYIFDIVMTYVGIECNSQSFSE